jgi:hypothetical protein
MAWYGHKTKTANIDLWIEARRGHLQGISMR